MRLAGLPASAAQSMRSATSTTWAAGGPAGTAGDGIPIAADGAGVGIAADGTTTIGAGGARTGAAGITGTIGIDEVKQQTQWWRAARGCGRSPARNPGA